MTRAAHVFVSGGVQGVSFRRFVQENAAKLRVSGWVRNREDGRVEAWLEGDEESVGQMLKALRTGPPAGRVDDVAIEWKKEERFSGFERRPTA